MALQIVRRLCGTAGGAALVHLHGIFHKRASMGSISLHDDIVSFVEAVSATQQEKIKRSAALQMVQDATKVAFRAAGQPGLLIQALAFGSHVNGLDSHRSDLDVVITGLLQPDSTEHNGYTIRGRTQVNRHLTTLKSCLFRKGMTSCVHIRSARLPILKCTMKSGAEVDISIADDSGVKAARYLAAEVQSRPPLRALVMVVKMLLRHKGLADGATGGLSSFALALMAISHLKASEQESCCQTENLGVHLRGFLHRYGSRFDLMTDAVAPARGGIVCKTMVPAMQKALRASYNATTSKKQEELLSRLCIEDPLTGREIAGGCYKAAEVLTAFLDGEAALESSPQVGVLMDVTAALERVTPSSISRAAAGGVTNSGSGSNKRRAGDNIETSCSKHRKTSKQTPAMPVPGWNPAPGWRPAPPAGPLSSPRVQKTRGS